MSIQDRDWYRRDYEKRRKRIEENEKEELRKKRQIGIDAMWNEVEPSRKTSDEKGESRPKWAHADKRMILSALKRVRGYKKILTDCTIENQGNSVFFDFILIHEAGLFAIRICDDYRIVRADGSAKYWTVEDYTRLGYSRYQERPTIQLEKDHAFLDQAIHKYMFIKSFAYLVFPEFGGLENVAGSQNQLTTERSLSTVLSSDIQHYGHAYSRTEIDQLYSVVKDSLSPKTAYQTTVHYSNIPRKNNRHSPFWMRAVQMLGVLAVLAVVLLVIANTEWGSSFMKEKDIRFPSIHLPSLTRKTEKPTEVARANPTSSTALIPSYLVYDGSTQAELDHFAAEYGMTYVKKETDGSLTLSSEKNLIHANVDALVATLTKQCGQPGYSHFSSVSVNEDYTVFTIVVNDVNMSNEEKQVVSDLFLMAGLQAVQTEQAVQNIRVERVNMLGSLISRENTNAERKAEQKPAAATTTPTSTVTVEMNTISSSKIVKEPSYEGTCPFSVILPNGDKDYYIYLKYLKPSSRSATDRNRITNDSVDDVAVYIKAHDNFSCQVPVGVYKLYYTLGDTWYGTEERFGTGAPTYTSEDLLEFYNDGQRWQGHTIELRPVTNGNLDRTKLPGSEFPKG